MCRIFTETLILSRKWEKLFSISVFICERESEHGQIIIINHLRKYRYCEKKDAYKKKCRWEKTGGKKENEWSVKGKLLSAGFSIFSFPTSNFLSFDVKLRLMGRKHYSKKLTIKTFLNTVYSLLFKSCRYIFETKNSFYNTSLKKNLKELLPYFKIFIVRYFFYDIRTFRRNRQFSVLL